MSVSPSHQRRPQPLTELPTRDQRRSRLQNPTPATRSFVLPNEHRQTVESLQKPWNLPSSPPTNSAPSPTYRLSERNAYIIVLPPPTLPVRRTPAKIRLAPLPQPPSSLSSWGGWRIPSPSVPSGPPSPPCPCRLLLPLAVRPGHGLGRPSSPRPVSSLSQGQILSCRSPQWPCFQGQGHLWTRLSDGAWSTSCAPHPSCLACVWAFIVDSNHGCCRPTCRFPWLAAILACTSKPEGGRRLRYTYGGHVKSRRKNNIDLKGTMALMSGSQLHLGRQGEHYTVP